MYESTLLMSTGEASVMRFGIKFYDCVALYLQRKTTVEVLLYVFLEEYACNVVFGYIIFGLSHSS